MIDDLTLLIPIDASAPEDPPQALVDLFEPLHIVVLGHYPVSNQAAPQQLQEAHEDEVKAAMEPIVHRVGATYRARVGQPNQTGTRSVVRSEIPVQMPSH